MDTDCMEVGQSRTKAGKKKNFLAHIWAVIPPPPMVLELVWSTRCSNSLRNQFLCSLYLHKNQIKLLYLNESFFENNWHIFRSVILNLPLHSVCFPSDECVTLERAEPQILILKPHAEQTLTKSTCCIIRSAWSGSCVFVSQTPWLAQSAQTANICPTKHVFQTLFSVYLVMVYDWGFVYSGRHEFRLNTSECSTLFLWFITAYLLDESSPPTVRVCECPYLPELLALPVQPVITVMVQPKPLCNTYSFIRLEAQPQVK